MGSQSHTSKYYLVYSCNPKSTMSNGIVDVDVDYDQLIELMKNDQPEEKKTILVDVRNADELVKDGKIVGSYNVPLPEISSAFQLDKKKFKLKYGFDLVEKDTENLILSCKAGIRADTARGRFLDWVKRGGSIEKDK